MSANAAAAPNAAPAAPSKKGKVLVIAIVALLALGGGGAGTWFYLRSQHDEPKAEAPQKKVPTVFLNLEPFTVNLADREHYLQTGVVFELENAALSEAIKDRLPIIRSRILLLLSSKTAEELATAEGKDKLIGEIIEEARGPLGEKEKTGITAAHFASLVIQ